MKETAERLLPSQVELVAKIRENITSAETSQEPLVLEVLGLSGLGKSQVFKEIQQAFPEAVSSTNGEVVVMFLNTIPIILIQKTVSASMISRMGGDDGPALPAESLRGLAEEAIKVVATAQSTTEPGLIIHPTLSRDEAAILMASLRLPAWIRAIEYNELTLGLPKLIYGCAKKKNKAEVLETVARYLVQYFFEVDETENLSPAITFFETAFLGDKRKLAPEIIEALKEKLMLLKRSQIYGSVLHLYQNDIILQLAVLNLHPQATQYYSLPIEKLGQRGNKTFELEAWIELSDEEVRLLAAEIEKEEKKPNFNRPGMGTVGDLLELFKLRLSRIGFQADSLIGGSLAKAEFVFQFSYQGESILIANTLRQLLQDTGVKKSAESQPNFKIEVHDHCIDTPAMTMCALEAVLQELEIKYEVSHPDGNQFAFDPQSGEYRQRQRPDAKKKIASK